MTRHVVGVYEGIEAAHPAVAALLDGGVEADQVSVLQWGDPAHSGEELLEYEQDERAEAINTGLWGGGALGGIAGLLAGAISLVVAPIGVVAVLGPLSSALGGATVGAAMGGFLGSLAKLGLSQKNAEHLMEELEAGSVVVAVAVPTVQAPAMSQRLTELGAGEVQIV